MVLTKGSSIVLAKKIFIAGPQEFNDLWFVYKMADKTCFNYQDPVEALKEMSIDLPRASEIPRPNQYSLSKAAKVTINLPKASKTISDANEEKPIIFISYSHKDEEEKNHLLSHLGVLQHTGVIRIWSDDQIRAGADWETEIKQVIFQAKVAILLISANFLTSNFILRKEIPALLQRRESRGATCFPNNRKILCLAKGRMAKKMNVRPKKGKPVWRKAGRNADDELAVIAEEVADIIDAKI